MEVLSPVGDIVRSPLVPALRESSRKRVKKTLGPDFIEDFSGSSLRIRTQDNADDVHNRVLIKKENNISPRKLLKKSGKKKKSPKKQKKTSENIEVLEPESPTKPCGQCGLPLPKSLINGYYDGEVRANTVHCTGQGCHYEVHVGCLAFPPLPGTQFHCPSCKRNQCVVCEKGNIARDESLIACSNCRDAYHYECHNPPAPRKPRIGADGFPTEWLCCVCYQAPKAQKIRKNPKPPKKRFRPVVPKAPITMARPPADHSYSLLVTKAAIPPALIGPRLYQPHTALIGTFRGFEDSLDGKKTKTGEDAATNQKPQLVQVLVPGQPYEPCLAPESLVMLADKNLSMRERIEKDCELRQDMATWSVEQCAAFFQDSDPELAQLILDHDLLGCALLVITRTQFLDLFQLPLGKALKMHAQICRCRRMFF